MGTALKEGLPLKLVKHQGDAVSAAVVYSAVTNLAALLCTISSWLVSSLVWGSQTVDAYSKMGRT